MSNILVQQYLLESYCLFCCLFNYSSILTVYKSYTECLILLFVVFYTTETVSVHVFRVYMQIYFCRMVCVINILMDMLNISLGGFIICIRIM